MADPLHQFQIKKIVDLPDVTLPVIGTVDLAITNSHVAMTIAFALIVLFLTMVTARATVVPGRLQTTGETLFGLIDNLTDSIMTLKRALLRPKRFHDKLRHAGNA